MLGQPYGVFYLPTLLVPVSCSMTPPPQCLELHMYMFRDQRPSHFRRSCTGSGDRREWFSWASEHGCAGACGISHGLGSRGAVQG
ncbi:hypothetical protein BKA62DRAFT_732877 [Auriculariales sp. MPI-PUGE-AT-0066]|nr:hypothetical protein BKA62DRAFT_732877 [Auriculariales sp. MPI-PUGE-AT-0066]